MSATTLRCYDCGAFELHGPDHEGFFDCGNCGAAYIPDNVSSASVQHFIDTGAYLPTAGSPEDPDPEEDPDNLTGMDLGE